MNKPVSRVHLIAMGGSVMHALAIALHDKGVQVSGSDDEFFDPARSNLQAKGLLPATSGWDAGRITADIDTVILGMHAHADNPELARARELGLPILSFPEFIYQQARNKQRIVIAGSHGKTTITAMIMHVLKKLGRDFDYVVGARVKGFEQTVRLSDAPVIVIEGDEYLSSRLDDTPKFLHYQHHIGLINGIAWDHVNVFPNEEEYIRQFERFADATPKAGSLAYYQDDPEAQRIGSKERPDVLQLPYGAHPHVVKEGNTYLLDGDREHAVRIFGHHNMINLNGARQVLSRLSVDDEEFYGAIADFELPDLRLNILAEGEDYTVFRDYAHAPSKVQATVAAVQERYPQRQLTAVFELHTYSSLNKDFFGRYAGTLNGCDQAIVYYNPQAVAQKKLPPFEPAAIEQAFAHPNLQVINSTDELAGQLRNLELRNRNLLLMSSAHFGGLDLTQLF